MSASRDDPVPQDLMKLPGAQVIYGGVAVTLIYLAAWIGYLAHEWAMVKDLKPNEIGDMLAGTFAPLAFLWLVIGYFQQQRELRLNTAALQLQVKELTEQTAALQQQHQETENLVKVGQGQLRVLQFQHDASVKMNLVPVQHTPTREGNWRFRFTNTGAVARNITVDSVSGPPVVSFTPSHALRYDSQFLVTLGTQELAPYAKLRVRYQDETGQARSFVIEVVGGEPNVFSEDFSEDD